jgi:protein tyrosine phosphatase (PTP) superfamily phosphohydrolase (DUF442 family)
MRKKECNLPSRLNRLSSMSLVLFLAAPICAQEAKPRLYRVDDNVYRGLQPTRPDIAKLASSGIRTVLDLRGALDHKGWEQQAVEAAGMRYIRLGMSGFFAPSNRQIDKILAVLEDPTLGPIFVHCRRGADQVGPGDRLLSDLSRSLDERPGDGGGAPAGVQPARSPDAPVYRAFQGDLAVHRALVRARCFLSLCQPRLDLDIAVFPFSRTSSRPFAHARVS